MFGLGPQFGRVWTAHATDQLAFETVVFVLPVLAASQFDASPGEIALVTASLTLPPLLLALPTGAWMDRHRRRGVMVAAGSVRATILLGLMVAVMSGWGDPITFAAIGFAFASFAMVTDIATMSLLPQVVGFAQLGLANARLELMRSLARMLAPAMAGFLIAAVSAPTPVAIAVGLLVLSTVQLIRLEVNEPTPAPAPGRLWRDMVDGLRFVIENRLLRGLSVSAMLWTLSATVIRISVVVLALTELDVPADAFGYALAAAGVGGLLGGVLSQPLAQRLPIGWVVTSGPTLALIGYSVLCVAPSGSWALWVIALGLFCEGLGSTLWMVGATTLRQNATPQAMLGRVAAVVRMISASARPIGALIAGVVAEQFGARAALFVAVAVTIPAVVILIRSPACKVRRAEDLRS